MKQFTTAVLAMILLATTASNGKAQELNTSLKDAFQNLSSATEMGGRMNAVNKFNVIAAKWGNQWAANYYAAYANAVVSLTESDPKRRDQLLDVSVECRRGVELLGRRSRGSVRAVNVHAIRGLCANSNGGLVSA